MTWHKLGLRIILSSSIATNGENIFPLRDTNRKKLQSAILMLVFIVMWKLFFYRLEEASQA